MPPKTADPQFRSLDPEKIICTLDLLAQRIGERFPHTGLERVSHELADIARHTSASVTAIARPNLLIRGFVAAVLATGLGLLAWLALLAIGLETSSELTNIMQGLDSATSMLLVLGGLALYLSTLESRWRRERAMKSLYELRAIIHVIDMHQLTKDPSAYGAPRMSSSPDRSMSSHQLLRYLGYCSELLSLASKVSALYADKLRDPAIVDAVGDIERLTAHLGQKIWQKIELVQQRMPTRPPSDALAPKGIA